MAGTPFSVFGVVGRCFVPQMGGTELARGGQFTPFPEDHPTIFIETRIYILGTILTFFHRDVNVRRNFCERQLSGRYSGRLAFHIERTALPAKQVCFIDCAAETLTATRAWQGTAYACFSLRICMTAWISRQCSHQPTCCESETLTATQTWQEDVHGRAPRRGSA